MLPGEAACRERCRQLHAEYGESAVEQCTGRACAATADPVFGKFVFFAAVLFGGGYAYVRVCGREARYRRQLAEEQRALQILHNEVTYPTPGQVIEIEGYAKRHAWHLTVRGSSSASARERLESGAAELLLTYKNNNALYARVSLRNGPCGELRLEGVLLLDEEDRIQLRLIRQ